MDEVPLKVRCFNMDFSRMLLAMATMVSLAYAHVHCYTTIDDPWACYGAYRRKRPTPVGSHCYLGVVTWCNHVGVDSTQIGEARKCIPSMFINFEEFTDN